MRVTAVSLFYAPDMAAGSQLLTELCEDLVTAGDEVTVICGRGTYLGGEPLPARETINGVRVERAWATSFGKSTIVGRLSDYGSFWASSIAKGLFASSPDVMLAVSFPPMIAAGAALAARRHGAPLVTWVQDVYPELAARFGLMSERSVGYRALRGLQRMTHAASARTVAISEGMAARLREQGAVEERTRVVPNWSDARTIRPRDGESAFRSAHDFAGRFVVMYSGNLGVAHEFQTLLGAARVLSTRRPEVLFVFIGDGQRKREAQGLASGLSNVRFMDYQPHASLGESLPSADAHVISLRDDLAGLVVPSKLYGAMACGRPVFYVGPPECEVGRVVRNHSIGWAGRVGDVEGLAAAIERAATDSPWAHDCGARARATFEARYDRGVATQAWRDVLKEAVAAR